MNTLLVKFHTLFLPELSEGPLMADGHHVLEEVASRRHVMLGFVLKCSDPRGPPWPTQCARISLPKGERQRFSRVSRSIPSSSCKFGSTTKCVTGSFSSDECRLVDEEESMRQHH